MILFAAASGLASPKCAPCHRQIYDRYSRTAMAQSSGPVGGGLIEESFDHAVFAHAPTGFEYQIARSGAKLVMSFANPASGMRGSKPLFYYVGSGAVARSYLLESDGYLFEAPVAYFAAGHKWGLAPGYDTYAYPYLTRSVMPACLTCHASFLANVSGAQNRYGNPPVGEGGVACERCHGPGEAHIGSGGRAAIVNPAKLAPEERDSVCSQCHLMGEVRVMKAGANWQSYRVGQRLSDSMTVFVRAGASPGVKVISHVEKLAQSACKRAAGDRLWCGACHDPHFTPTAAERAAWYRGKCLTCHTGESCRETKAARDARQDDCTSCHMPKSAASDAQHVVYTDHSIPRRPRVNSAAPSGDLVVFGGARAAARDLALAYGIVASRTHKPADQARAQAALEQTVRSSPSDVEALVYLAELYRNGDQDEKAIPLYRRAMDLDPSQVTASVGLGGILMARGQDAQAIRLWQDALAKNAGLELVRINMAMAQWRSGDRDGALRTLDKAIELNPGFSTPVELLHKLQQAR